MSKLNTFFKGTMKFIELHNSEILTAVGVAGMASATISAFKLGTKASRIIKEESRIAESNGEEYTKLDAVKDTWTCWVPPVLLFTASAGCIIGANRLDAKKNAALATAYKLSDTAFKEYRKKVVDQLGEKKDSAVLGAIAKDHIEKNPPTPENILDTKDGGDLICFDPNSGRYFRSSINAIEKAVNTLNKRIYGDMEMYASLNDFYDIIGIPRIDIGDLVGWNSDSMVEFSPGYCGDKDGNPCLELNFRIDPRVNYEDLR